MFDLISKGATPVRDERREIENGMERFKKETGYDFLELMNNRQLRAKMLISSEIDDDIAQDETSIQNAFGSLQKKCWECEK